MHILCLLGLLAQVCLAIASSQAEEKPTKFAPRYCIRMRFNCEVQSAHICCRFPLPPADTEGGISSSADNTVRTSPIGASGVKIRPIALSTNKKPEGKPEVDVENISNNTAEVKKPNAIGNKRKPSPLRSKPAVNQITEEGNSSSSSSTSVPTTNAVTNASQPPSPALNIISKKKPMLCLRLVIKCAESPEHRCCQFEKEEEDQSTEGKVHHQPEEAEKAETTVATTATATTTSSTTSAASTTTISPTTATTPTPTTTTSTTTTTTVATATTSIPRTTTTLNEVASDDRWVSSVEAVELDTPKAAAAIQQLQDLQPVQPNIPSLSDAPNVALAGAPTVAVIHQKIPAECFIQTLDCNVNPEHICCAYMR